MDTLTLYQAGANLQTCDGCQNEVQESEIEISDEEATICTTCIEDPERMDPGMAAMILGEDPGNLVATFGLTI